MKKFLDDDAVVRAHRLEERREAKAQSSLELRNWVHLWIEQTGVELEWLPAECLTKWEQKDAPFIDWGYRWIVNDHRISEFYAVSLIAAYCRLVHGISPDYGEIGIFLREWATAHFTMDVPESVRAAIGQRIKIIVKRGRGRPRKQATCHIEIEKKPDDSLHLIPTVEDAPPTPRKRWGGS